MVIIVKLLRHKSHTKDFCLEFFVLLSNLLSTPFMCQIQCRNVSVMRVAMEIFDLLFFLLFVLSWKMFLKKLFPWKYVKLLFF